jgi:CRISPR/Cas system-associated endoribonuclease Cas2
MGEIERKARKRRQWGSFKTGVLLALGVVGLILVSAAAPNTLQLLRYLPGYKRGARFTYQTKSALTRLASQGFVVFIEKEGRRYARITELGQARIQLEVAQLEGKKKQEWDKRWRVVMFDIPERRKKVRDRLRKTMDKFGFVRLQDSVWVYPYDCEDLIALTKAEFKIGADVLYLIAEFIERDKHLREHFKLPLE